MQKLYEFVTVAISRAGTFELRDLKREDGQGAVEYALVVLAIAAIVALTVGGLATEIGTFLSKAGTKIGSYAP